MEVAAGLQEGQGEAPGLQRVRTRANDASSTLGELSALLMDWTSHLWMPKSSGHPNSINAAAQSSSTLLPGHVTSVSCSAAMVHDAADSDSETEAVQEAATVPGGGAGFGAENDVPPASEREVSVVSNASNGGGSPAATDDDASLVQGAAHSAFAGGGRRRQAASEVQVSFP